MSLKIRLDGWMCAISAAGWREIRGKIDKIKTIGDEAAEAQYPFRR